MTHYTTGAVVAGPTYIIREKEEGSVRAPTRWMILAWFIPHGDCWSLYNGTYLVGYDVKRRLLFGFIQKKAKANTIELRELITKLADGT